MSHYLMLLRLRDISQNNLIRKAKVYLAGRQPPAGVKIHQGPRGKPYYMSEDLKALKESKKKDKPKEESGEKKKRLPAFRKQEDGTVLHRTKDGEHGPGAYRIESTDGEHHLTFEGKDGDVKSLGKHTDIKELKRMVAGFKGGEKEKVKEDSFRDIIPEERRAEYDKERRVTEEAQSHPGYSIASDKGKFLTGFKHAKESLERNEKGYSPQDMLDFANSEHGQDDYGAGIKAVLQPKPSKPTADEISSQVSTVKRILGQHMGKLTFMDMLKALDPKARLSKEKRENLLHLHSIYLKHLSDTSPEAFEIVKEEIKKMISDLQNEIDSASQRGLKIKDINKLYSKQNDWHNTINYIDTYFLNGKPAERKTKPRVKVPEKKSTMQAWKEITHPEEYPEHQPERKTKPRVKVPDEKPVSQVKDQKATVRRRKEADRIKEGESLMTPEAAYDRKQFIADNLVFRTGTKSAREKNGQTSQVMRHKTKPGWYTVKHFNGATEDFDSADSLYDWARRGDLGSLIRRIEEDRGNILDSDAGKEYIRKVERDIINNRSPLSSGERKTKPRVKVPDEKPVSQVKDQKATVRRRKEAETQQPGFTAKLGRGYTIGWSGNQFQRVEVTDPDTNETSVYDIKMREGTRGKQLFTKTGAKAEAIRLATERKEKGSDAIIQGISDKMHEQKTKPSAPLAQQAIDKHIASNKEKNIDRLVFARSGDSYLTSTGETVPANKLEQNVNRLSIEHGKYVDVLEQVNKQGDLGHVRTISTPGTEDKPFSSGDKQASSGERKKERLKNFSQLEAHIYAKRLEADGYRNVKLEKQIRGGNPDSGHSTDYWYELSYDLPEKEEKKQNEIAKQYPELAGDKRHDPDQKKIATGLGETTKKKAKESVAEFGVDTRQKIKEIAEKKTRQDRLSQNRLDTKNW